MDLFTIFIVSVILGCLIGSSKGQFASGLLWSLLLGPLGVLIVLCLPNLTKRKEHDEHTQLLKHQLQLQQTQIAKLEQLYSVAVQSGKQISQIPSQDKSTQTADSQVLPSSDFGSWIRSAPDFQDGIERSMENVERTSLIPSSPISSFVWGEETIESEYRIPIHARNFCLAAILWILAFVIALPSIRPASSHPTTTKLPSTAQVTNKSTKNSTSVKNSVVHVDEKSLSDAIEASEEIVKEILRLSSLTIPNEWSPATRRHFRSLVSNALEIQEVTPSLKDALVLSTRSDATKKDRTHFYRFHREWQRLMLQYQVRHEEFQAAYEADETRSRLAEVEGR